MSDQPQKPERPKIVVGYMDIPQSKKGQIAVIKRWWGLPSPKPKKLNP